MKGNECLICLKNCSVIICNNEGESGGDISVQNGLKFGRKNKPFELLGKQLHVIFILKEILRIEGGKLEKFLETSNGNNPEDWVRICGDCDGMVEKARGYFEEMVQAKRRFERIREKMLQTVKECCSKMRMKPDLDNCSRGSVLTISEIIQNCVIDRNSEHVQNSHICGDLDGKQNRAMPTSLSPQKLQNAPDDQNEFHEPEDFELDYHDDNNSDMEISSIGTPPASPKVPADQDRGSNTWKLIRPAKHHREAKSKEYKHRIRYKQKVPCPHCGKPIEKFRMNDHIKRVHDRQFIASCELCGLTRFDSSNLRSHQADAHNICSLETCKMVLENREELHKHQVTLHGKEIDVFGCDQCEKLYVNSKSMRRHKELHEFERKAEQTGDFLGERKWICDLCGNRFATRNNLYSHKWSVHMRRRKLPSKKVKIVVAEGEKKKRRRKKKLQGEGATQKGRRRKGSPKAEVEKVAEKNEVDTGFINMDVETI